MVADTSVSGVINPVMVADTSVCCNGTRVFVERSIKDEFVEKLVSKTKGMKIGRSSSGNYDGSCDFKRTQGKNQVEDHMTVAKEEIFGPVLSLFTFDTEEEAVRRANDSEFGLAAGVFTNDLKRAHRLSAQLEAGYVWVNNFNLNPVGLPFGGFKQSGIGRENAAATINQFTQQKSVYFEMGDVDCPY
ncbi:betaine-aldehyde dehydrogenase [Apostichopus japonicus]|uniref:Betaine-aldehyde dehydrogenase n=1 Tax=Stichopus japonicus TaxID=307972 RepID=A0A2G8L2D4_STIJA|nr:betaine-aldehyde dehydrogenase [Apostichopus japonicus]